MTVDPLIWIITISILIWTIGTTKNLLIWFILLYLIILWYWRLSKYVHGTRIIKKNLKIDFILPFLPAIIIIGLISNLLTNTPTLVSQIDYFLKSAPAVIIQNLNTILTLILAFSAVTTAIFSWKTSRQAYLSRQKELESKNFPKISNPEIHIFTNRNYDLFLFETSYQESLFEFGIKCYMETGERIELSEDIELKIFSVAGPINNDWSPRTEREKYKISAKNPVIETISYEKGNCENLIQLSIPLDYKITKYIRLEYTTLLNNSIIEIYEFIDSGKIAFHSLPIWKGKSIYKNYSWENKPRKASRYKKFKDTLKGEYLEIAMYGDTELKMREFISIIFHELRRIIKK